MSFRSLFLLGVVLAASAALAGQPFLLIPESTNDTVGMYDPFDGSYLGDLIVSQGEMATPINAVLGPDNLIYLSDQVADSVFRYDLNGELIDVFAGPDDGLNNIRGIAFRDGELFVTSGDDYVARFDSSGNRLPDFINDGSDPFDIFFLDDGRALLSDIAGDQVRLYDADGTFASTVFAVNFPEQIQQMVSTGHYLNASFSGDWLTEFDVDGTIFRQIVFDAGRGIYELGNGRWLATSGSGVFSIDPDTLDVITIRSGISARFIELVPEPATALLVSLGVLGLRRRRN